MSWRQWLLVRPLVGSVGVILLLPVMVLTAPLWLPVAAVTDLLGGMRRLPTVRLGLFAVAYLIHSWASIALSIGLAALSLVTGGPGSAASLTAHRRVQSWWAGSLLDWARRLLNVHFQFPDAADLPNETFILASRHASMVDAVIPIPLVTGSLDRFAHYILKDELRWDPSIGSFGPRLNNVFVARGGDTEGDLTRIETMVESAQPNAVFVIFPEGTYATPANRRRILASLQRKVDAGDLESSVLTQAEGLRHVLPPKTLGLTTLQNAAPTAPVVIMGHSGLEGVSELQGLRQRMPLSKPVAIQWWVYPASDVPADDVEFASWLHDRWRELDKWVDAELAS